MHDALALAAAIRDGQVTAVEVMEASLSACIERADYGAVVQFDEEMARAGAVAADKKPPEQRGSFHGVPFLIKDLGGFAKGLPASAGSAAVRALGEVPDADNDLIGSFRNAGLIPFGLTATPTFGPSLSCEPEGLPVTRNPWDSALTSGGSSGGAAAAVAAGIIAISHATDAAGSIRVPAACCGLTGLKPSRGAVPASPDFNNYLMGIASELVLARSVRDVRAAFDVFHRPLHQAELPERPRVGVSIPDVTGPDQRNAVRGMAEALVDAGCELCEPASLQEIGSEAHRIAWQVIAVSLTEWLDLLNLDQDQVPPLVAVMAAKARSMQTTELYAITREIARLTFETNGLFCNCDAILMPVLSQAPVAVGTFDLSGLDLEDHLNRMQAFAPNAALANVAGLPALALPFGTSSGLPVGAQLLGPMGCDAALLRLGTMIEARAPQLRFPHEIAGFPA